MEAVSVSFFFFDPGLPDGYSYFSTFFTFRSRSEEKILTCTAETDCDVRRPCLNEMMFVASRRSIISELGPLSSINFLARTW